MAEQKRDRQPSASGSRSKRSPVARSTTLSDRGRKKLGRSERLFKEGRNGMVYRKVPRETEVGTPSGVHIVQQTGPSEHRPSFVPIRCRNRGHCLI